MPWERDGDSAGDDPGQAGARPGFVTSDPAGLSACLHPLAATGPRRTDYLLRFDSRAARRGVFTLHGACRGAMVGVQLSGALARGVDRTIKTNEINATEWQSKGTIPIRVIDRRRVDSTYVEYNVRRYGMIRSKGRKRGTVNKADKAAAQASAHLYNAARAYVMAVDAVTIGGKTGRKATNRAAMTEMHLVDVAFEYVETAMDGDEPSDEMVVKAEDYHE